MNREQRRARSDFKQLQDMKRLLDEVDKTNDVPSRTEKLEALFTFIDDDVDRALRLAEGDRNSNGAVLQVLRQMRWALDKLT